MRKLFLHDRLLSHGAQFGERCGAEIVSVVSSPSQEYGFVRDAVGVTDFSYVCRYRVPEETGVDFLDAVVAGNVAKLRFGRVLHTFIADDSGKLVADCYVANNDDELVMVCESLAGDTALDALLESKGATDAGLEKLCDSHVALSVDGFKAWKVAKELFGSDVLGLPYLSIEMYPFEGETIRLLRAGKTSEFGYLLIAPVAMAEKLLDALVVSARGQGGGLCGSDVHNGLRLEGRFFNIYAEGAAVGDPLTLGLQWMIDFDKEDFSGSTALFARRSDGLKNKIIGIVTPEGEDDLPLGSTVHDGAEKVAEVVASCYSHVLKRNVGLAVFPNEIAFAGLSFTLNGADGRLVETVSMPPIMPKSLGVKLDEM